MYRTLSIALVIALTACDGPDTAQISRGGNEIGPATTIAVNDRAIPIPAVQNTFEATLPPSDPKGVKLERLQVGKQQLAVPSTHVRSIIREPHKFVRIKHPDTQFELVYDSRLAGEWDQQGIARIFSVNHAAAPGIEYHQIGGTLVVCRKAPAPNGGCGTKLRFGDADWRVLFPEARLQEAPLILRQASKVLSDYKM